MTVADVWVPQKGPVRQFAAVNLLNTTGSGLFVAGGALFFTRALELPVSVVALGMSVGLAVGLACSLRFGRLADVVGPRPVYAALLGLQAAAMTAYPFVETQWHFFVVAVMSGIADRGIAGTVGAVVHAVTGGADRARVRAQLRSTTNVGLASGALLAGVALSRDTDLAYTCLVWGNAAIFAVSALLVRRIAMTVPTVPPRSLAVGSSTGATATASRPRPLRDRRYLVLTGLNGLLSLHVSVLSFALPLWVAGSIDAPLWMVSALLGVNTVMVVALQAPLSGLSSDFSGAQRSAALAGVALAASCVVMASTGSLNGGAVIAALLVWVVVFTAGELMQASCQFFVGFELAPDHAQGAYQAVFALGPGLMRTVAPMLVSIVVLANGASGWLVLGMGFLVTGLVLSWMVRHASMTTHRASDAVVTG